MISQLAPFLRPFQRHSLTQGERSTVTAYFGIAFLGAALGLNVVLTLGGAAAWIAPFRLYDYWVILSGGLGGCIGLYLGREWMGHDGPRGFGRALVGIIWISFLGALVGGTLALPFYGTMFGPFTLVVTLVGTPLLAAVWISALFSAHLMMKERRIEHDSIHRAELPR